MQVFDFTQPWTALIQIALIFVLPILVGLVTDRLTAGVLKVVLLGGLTFLATIGNVLLDALVGGLGAAGVDWANVLGNGLLTWFLAIAAYMGILKPSGVTGAAQEASVVQLFGPSQKRLADEEKKAA